MSEATDHPHTHDHHADQHGGHHGGHHGDQHGDQHGGAGLNAMAISATRHCHTGCAIGEILGLVLGTALGLGTGGTIVLAIALAFVFGYSLSTLPLLRAGLGVGSALAVVLAADTLSIATMEVVDNLVMLLVPGAMEAGLVDAVFWLGMMISLAAAFFAAWPVNRALLRRGKGHALTHAYHGANAPSGARRYIPALSTATLVAAITAFMLGGLLVALAVSAEDPEDGSDHAAALANRAG